MGLLADLSPSYYGEDRLRLTLAEPSQRLLAFRGILIAVDYSLALPEGIVLPLEFTVTAPTAVNSVRQVFRRFAPTELAFTPREGGSFLIRLAECWHNRWIGVLVLEIEGDRVRSA